MPMSPGGQLAGNGADDVSNRVITEDTTGRGLAGELEPPTQ